MTDPTHVGVVGAGTMGRGVSQCLAQSGYEVTLIDLDSDSLEDARRAIRRDIRRESRYRQLFSRPKGNPADLDALDHIQFTQSYDSLSSCCFVIENTTENFAVKRDVYLRMDRICPEDTIFAANTSAIPITKLASHTSRPQSMLGMHFMNPAPLMPLVEVIRAFHTSEATLSTAKELLARLGKECIVVNDAPGFVTNRVMMLTVNEAICLLHEGVSTAADIDRLFKTCFGHKMGPLETGDLIGLDTILYSLEVLHEEHGDPKFRPCPLLKSMVYAGRLGRKTGEGFHSY